MTPFCKALQDGMEYRQMFQPGLYEIHYRFTADAFDPDSMMFEWQGRVTGPWDYAPFGPRNGDCLLPKVHLVTSTGVDVQARVFIPRRNELDAKCFNGRVGFRVTERAEISLRLTASEKAQWVDANIQAVEDFLDPSLKAGDFDTNGLFFLDGQNVELLRQTWGKSVFSQQLDRILDDCGRFAPPQTQQEARTVASEFLKTRQVYCDNYLFYGDYLACLSLRSKVLNRPEDIAQLTRWVGALVALPVWGQCDDPQGRDCNNDLTADFNMLGLTLALNWNRGHFGAERIDQIEKKIQYQARQMLSWITRSRSSWPGVKTQNHAFFGYQTLMLAGMTLLHAGGSYRREALDWLQIACAASRRFADHLPTDGTYHEGFGYVSFGLYGLLPSLLLLEQCTKSKWLPQAWLKAHFPAINAVMPANASTGFDIDDGDGYMPCNVPVTAWAWQHAEDAEVRHCAGQILAKMRNGKGALMHEPNRMIGLLWHLLLTPGLLELEGNLPAVEPEGWRQRYLPASGCALYNLSPTSKAYFLSAPPHGHEQFRNEQHTYAYGHHHPDTGNVLLIDDGQWVLADTGYTYCKASSEHNVLLVNGQGQYNDGYVWMPPPPWDIEPTKLQSESFDDYTRSTIDLAYIYPKSLGLQRWQRTLYALDGCLICHDEVVSREPSTFTLSWGSKLAWQQIGSASYALPNGWTFHHLGDALNIGKESLRPASRFPDQRAPWHVLRLRNPHSTRQFRVLSVFTAPTVTASPTDLLQRVGLPVPHAFSPLA